MRSGRIYGWGVLVALAVLPVHAEPPPGSDTTVASVEPVGDAPYDATGRRDPFRPVAS